jgi:hypothetical protein
MNYTETLPREIWKYHILYNLNVSDLLNLYIVNNETRNLLESSETLEILIQKWIPFNKVEIYTFADFLDEYDRYNNTNKCFSYYDVEECVINFIRSGGTDDAIRIILNKYDIKLKYTTIIWHSLESNNFYVADYICTYLRLRGETEEWRASIKSFVVRINDIEVIKWYCTTPTLNTTTFQIVSLLEQPISKDSFQWICQYMENNDQDWVDKYKFLVPYIVSHLLLTKGDTHLMFLKYPDRSSLGEVFAEIASADELELVDFKKLNDLSNENLDVLLWYVIGKGNLFSVKLLVNKYHVPIFITADQMLASKNDALFEYLLKKHIYQLSAKNIEDIVINATYWRYNNAIIILLDNVIFDPVIIKPIASYVVDNLDLLNAVIKNIAKEDYPTQFNDLIFYLFEQACMRRSVKALELIMTAVNISNDIVNKIAIKIVGYHNLKVLNWLLDNATLDIYGLMEKALSVSEKRVQALLLEKYPNNLQLQKMTEPFVKRYLSSLSNRVYEFYSEYFNK